MNCTPARISFCQTGRYNRRTVPSKKEPEKTSLAVDRRSRTPDKRRFRKHLSWCSRGQTSRRASQFGPFGLLSDEHENASMDTAVTHGFSLSALPARGPNDTTRTPSAASCLGVVVGGRPDQR